VEQTSQEYRQYLDFLNDGPSPVPDVTEAGTFLFPVIIIHIGHDVCENLKDCWLTAEQFSPFLWQNSESDRFFHILRFLTF
jgi:hypothetical protein